MSGSLRNYNDFRKFIPINSKDIIKHSLVIQNFNYFNYFNKKENG